ncbi:hypothetical protein OC845_003419 [Tilletia horrida]|nr:hypothetical protein OC845_003419 [Tilletia horrida]
MASPTDTGHSVENSSIVNGRRESTFTAGTLVEQDSDHDLDLESGSDSDKAADAKDQNCGASEEKKKTTSDPSQPKDDSNDTAVQAAIGSLKTVVSGKHVFNEQTNYALPFKKILAVFLTTGIVAMAALLDQTILATALTTIGQDLRAGSQITWVSNAFFLTSTSFQLLYGKVSDIVGRKVCLLFCLAVFFIGSLASSLAQDVIQLSIFRAISGIGGGGLITLSQVIISDVVSLRERGRYQGIMGSIIAISNGVGPVIGGTIAQRSSWRNIFHLQLGLIPFSAALVIFIMPLKKVTGSWKKKAAAIDYLGAFLTLAAAALIVLGLNWAGGEYSWDSTHVLVPLFIGLALAVVFVLHQWKGSKNPLMPLNIFRNTMVAGGSLTMFVNGFIFVTQTYNVVQMYQIVYGSSPIRAGILFIPLALMQTVSSTMAGFCVSRLGRYREILLAGWAIWAVGMGMFSTLGIEPNVGKQVGFAILAGFGVGGTLQVSLVAIQSAVPRKQMAVVTATRNFIRNLGAAFGLAVAQTTIQSSARAQLGWNGAMLQRALNDPRSLEPDQLAQFREAYLVGFRRLFYILASLASFSFVIVWFFMPQLSIDRADDQQLKSGRTPEELAAEKERAEQAAREQAGQQQSRESKTV